MASLMLESSASSPLIEIEISVPEFKNFALADDILRALADLSYFHPTPIQSKAIPVVLQGRDIVGGAQTGTGKTASFCLPVIQLLLPHANYSASPARHRVRALILTPTRELADQVAENMKAYARYTPLRSVAIYGGVDMMPQTVALRSGAEILIATPGRLLDHIQQKTVSLAHTEILVMDEADRMLDMGFLPDLQRIVGLLPAKRQSLMFSATFSPAIKKLAATFLNNPVTIEVTPNNTTADRVSQTVYKIEESFKRDAIVHLLKALQLTQVLIFSNTKIGASRLSRHLEQEGIKATAIHGDKSQTERMAALEAFKNGSMEVLVATDVAARGLDIEELPCVINLDLPGNAEDYVHRIGRTGRAGASGEAISLYSDKDKALLADIEKIIKYKFVIAELKGFIPPSSAAFRSHEKESRHRAQTTQTTFSNPSRSIRTGNFSANRTVSRKETIDPWFLKPYEPALSPASRQNTTKSVTTDKTKSAKSKIAVLLGGSSS